MNILSLLDSENCPNSTFVERIVHAWNPPDIVGQIELSRDESAEKICFRFRGTLPNNTETSLGWTLDELFFQHPALISALEIVTQRFLQTVAEHCAPFAQCSVRKGGRHRTALLAPELSATDL